MLIYTRHDPRFYDRRLHKGGGGATSTTGATTTTENNDKRIAVQDGLGLSGDGSQIITDSHDWTSFVDNSNSSDAVIAMAGMGADVIKSSGAAVLDLGRFQGQQNTDAWNTTITQGAKLIDNLIDRTADVNALAAQVVTSFTPTENKNADIGKYAMIAAAVVAGAVLLGGVKK